MMKLKWTTNYVKKPRIKVAPGKSAEKRAADLRARAAKIKLPRRKAAPESRFNEAIENLPRITNETVAEHREELLSSARKYIYPLKHTKHRVVMISVSLLVSAVVLFFAYTTLALYKFQSNSTFLYYVTQVIPFPVAKAGASFVAYENYLFELRHYVHYYQTQQQVNFNAEAGKQQLAVFKKQALQQVVQDAYVKQLASKYHVRVSGQEVDNEVALLRVQNRLGSSDQQFSDVLKDFWGWSVSDFKRELKQQLLAQKVAAELDTDAQTKAQNVLTQAHGGADFAKLAKKYSNDAATKNNGGALGFAVSQNSRDLSPLVLDALFKLKPGQVSGLIDTGYAFEIVKVTSAENGKVQASHITISLKGIDSYVKPLQASKKPHFFIPQ
jgi:parvulin-like peptidyl-prolyl isomerase